MSLRLNNPWTLWKNISGKEIYLYINFEKSILRIAGSDEDKPANGEVAFAVHPAPYRKDQIEGLCRDLGLHHIVINGQAIEQPRPFPKNYLKSLVFYDNPDAKRDIFMLRKTGLAEPFNQLLGEKVLIPVRIQGLKIKPFYITVTNDDTTEKLLPVFTTSNEYDDFQKRHKAELQEYAPLLSELRYVKKIREHDTGVIVNPQTVNVCRKKLGVTLSKAIWH